MSKTDAELLQDEVERFLGIFDHAIEHDEDINAPDAVDQIGIFHSNLKALGLRAKPEEEHNG